MEERSEIRAAEPGDLPGVRTVGVGNPDFHPARADGPLGQQTPIIGRVPRGGGIAGPPDDHGPVGRVKRAAIVADPVGDPPHVGPVDVHGVQLDVAVLGGREDDALPIGRHR